MSGEQTEKATPQRKKKAQEKGDWVRSRELLSGAAMLAGLMTLGLMGGRFIASWRQCFDRCIAFAVDTRGSVWNLRMFTTVMRVALLPAVVPTATILGASFCVVLFVGLAQSGGVQFNPSAMQPKLERLSPGTHIKQMFSLRAIARLMKSLLPALVVAFFGWKALHNMMEPMPVLSMARLPETFATAYGLGVKAAWVMVCWAALDYAVEYRSWSQRLMMSKQEMKEEARDSNGNPQVKGRLRQLQRAMRRRKAKADMSRASVVITNPTHYAVALEFSFETMAAPTVLTKGRDLHALDIREEARWAGVPIIENPPLARSLYRSVEPGQQIPYDLYAAVAGILAFLFRQQQEEKMRDQQRTQRDRNTKQLQTQLQGFQGGM
jgi:flagellar biosynthetic protein FlhB